MLSLAKYLPTLFSLITYKSYIINQNHPRGQLLSASVLSLRSVGKTEKEFVVEDVENLKTINKIVPMAVNSNSSQCPSISGVVSRKMRRDSVSKNTMINLQAKG